jgi:hypothetical protein
MLDEEDWIKSMYIQYIIHRLFIATRLHFLIHDMLQNKRFFKKNVISNYKMKRLLCIYCSKMIFFFLGMNFQQKKFKLQNGPKFQYHSSKKMLAKNSTNSLNFEIYAKFQTM